MEVSPNNRSGVGISLGDLETVSEAVMLRLDDPEQETLRVARMRELLWAASELTRALSIHTQHALVDCSGTHGNGDLATDTRALHRALGHYAHLVSEVAAGYRDLVPSAPHAAGRSARHPARDMAEARS
jgi:hypothetical protein